MATSSPITRLPALVCALLAAPALAIASSGCASGDSEAEAPEAGAPSVSLFDRSRTTNGKVLQFTASTNDKLYRAGGRFAIELRGIDTEPATPTTFAKPDYVDPSRCDLQPCEWSVLPDTASTYEFRAFLVDLKTHKPAAQSPSVQAVWTAPPRPHDIKVLINGKSMPITTLTGGDEYLPIPVGKLEVEARWTTDVGGTGYYVVVSTAEPQKRVRATCRTGTSCRVPTKVPILADQEMSWEVRVLTTRGDKLAQGFKVCLDGKA